MGATLLDTIAAAAREVWAVRYYLVALAAALYASYLLHFILARLDRGSSGTIGRRITKLVLVLLAMLVATYNATYNVNVTYGVAGLVLLVSAVARQIWPSPTGMDERPPRPAPESSGDTRRPAGRRASVLLLQGGALLLVLLWVLQRAFRDFKPNQSSSLELLATFAGTGLLAMAIVQGLRTLLPLRGVFHRLVLERWIADAIEGPFETPSYDGSNPPEPPRRPSPRAIRRALTRLAQGPVTVDKYALLDLPIEQLCGQIAAGADRLLDEPSLESFIEPGTPPASAVPVFDVLTALAAGPRDVERYLTLAQGVRDSVQAPAFAEAPDSREYVRLRANLSQRIQRNIDGLQIATAFWWRRSVRGLVFAICGVEGLSVFSGDPTLSAVCAVVGGFIATASRDVVAIIEKARR